MRAMFAARAAALFATAALALACNRGDIAPPKPKPVTPDEAKAFASKLETALRGCDPGAIDQLIDMDAMARMAAATSKASKMQQRGFVAGARKNAKIGAQLCQNVASAGQYKLLRVRTEGETTRALYRLSGFDGFNYLDVFVGKTSRGILGYDIYNYLSGQRFSETLRDLFDSFLADDPGLGSATRIGDAMQEIERLSAAGQHQQAKDKIASLPDNMRKSRAIMLIDVTTSANLSDEVYHQAIANYETQFPGDVSLDLVSVDGYFLRKEWDKAIAALDRLDKRVGGDPYIDSMRATIRSQEGKYDEAARFARSAVDREPDLEDGYWTLLEIQLAAETYDDAVATMRKLASDFAAEFDRASMAAEPSYSGFLESPQGKAFFAD
jgi:tetratricopeptide (TPR) repeat protein